MAAELRSFRTVQAQLRLRPGPPLLLPPAIHAMVRRMREPAPVGGAISAAAVLRSVSPADTTEE